MSQELWTAVDHFISEALIPSDPALDAALESSAASGLPSIQVSPSQGKLLHLMARAQGARRILEIGTLGGYSTIWLARALPPGGRLITLEADPKHAEVARANLSRAGLAGEVEVRLGRALDILPGILAEGLGPFDLVFIDADKPNIPAYVRWSLRLTRPGSLVIVDNIVRTGAVIDPTSTDPNVIGAREMYNLLAKEPRLCATAIQTVGSKGYDGFVVALVAAEP